ncbi:MAG: hypothetical protein AABY99_07400, partial [Pseudomonadota bacterium]
MDQEKLSSIIMAASSFYYTLTEEQIRRLVDQKMAIIGILILIFLAIIFLIVSYILRKGANNGG